MEKTMTVSEAARKLRISRSSIYAAMRRGQFKPGYGGIDGRRIVGVYADAVETLAAKAMKEHCNKGGAR